MLAQEHDNLTVQLVTAVIKKLDDKRFSSSRNDFPQTTPRHGADISPETPAHEDGELHKKRRTSSGVRLFLGMA